MAAGKFWETMNLMIGKEYRRTGKEVMEDVEDWVDKVVVKKELSYEETQNNLNIIKNGDVKSWNRSLENEDEEKEVEDFIKSVELPKIECTYVT